MPPAPLIIRQGQNVVYRDSNTNAELARTLGRLRKQLKLSVFADPGGNGSNWRRLFQRKYDVNHDGQIDLEEFTTIIRQDHHTWTKTLPNETILHAFKAIDTDGSGSIDIDEFLAWFNYKPSADEISHILGSEMGTTRDMMRQAEQLQQKRQASLIRARRIRRTTKTKLSSLRRMVTNIQTRPISPVHSPGSTQPILVVPDDDLSSTMSPGELAEAKRLLNDMSSVASSMAAEEAEVAKIQTELVSAERALRAAERVIKRQSTNPTVG
jgi:hypothetical protein